MSIHPTAIIDPAAKLATTVTVGPYSIIGANVEIGDDTWIAPHVVLNGPTKIGRANKIYQFASLGESTQALGQNPAEGILEIGDRNTFREYATVNRGSSNSEGITRIGNDNLLMAYTHIAHDCVLGNHIIFSNSASVAGHVHIGDHAILSGFALVHQEVRIGTHSFVGFGAGTSQDVAPYTTVSGNRAVAYGINKEGLRRRKFSADTIKALATAYRELLYKHQSREQAIATLQPLVQQYPEVAGFVEFIQQSQRGVVRSKNAK